MSEFRPILIINIIIFVFQRKTENGWHLDRVDTLTTVIDTTNSY